MKSLLLSVSELCVRLAMSKFKQTDIETNTFAVSYLEKHQKGGGESLLFCRELVTGSLR